MFGVFYIGGLEDLQRYDHKAKYRQDEGIDAEVLTKADIVKWFYETEHTSVIVEESKMYRDQFIVCTMVGDVYVVEAI